MVKKDATKRQGSIAQHALMKTRNFIIVMGFPKISLVTRTCFLEHQHSMTLGYGWLLCLSPFRPLLYLLNLFCACFLPVPLIAPCIVFVDCLNACDGCPVRQLSCTGNLHAYDRQLKKGMIWCKEKKLHCLLNLSPPIRYKNPSSYTEIHVVAVVPLLLRWIFYQFFRPLLLH